MISRRGVRLRQIALTHRRDLTVAGGLAAAATALHLWSTHLLPPTDNLPFFGADTARAARHMTVRAPMLDRSQFHLLFPLLAQTPTRAAMVLGEGRLDAVHLAIAVWGGIVAAGFYLTARRLGWAPLGAAGAAALVTVAGASVVFFAIPETYGVASGVVTLALLVIAGWSDPPSVLQGAAALVLGICVTLPAVVLPLVAIGRSKPRWRRAAEQVTLAGAVLAILLVVQRVVFGTEIDATISGESQFLHSDVGSRALLSLRTALVDAWATPSPSLNHGVVTFRVGGWWSGGPLRLLAVLALAALWVLVARGAWKRRANVVVLSCVAAVAAQVLLSSFYGDEPFLYSATLVPLMVALAIASVGHSSRRCVTGLCWILVPILGVLNLQHLHTASHLVGSGR